MINKTPAVFFVTGTDTNVGKTFISCGILQAAKNAGFTTAALKPIAAGGDIVGEELRNEDAVMLRECSSLSLSYEAVNPICFKQAIAPHIAAKKENKQVNTEELVALSQEVLEKKADITVIEGAGGWRVPINAKDDFSSFVKAVDAPVILVVAMRLGCLNHAVLSAQAILSDNASLKGWIANQIDPSMLAYQDNLSTLKAMLPVPLLAEIDYVENFSSSSNCSNQIDITKIMEVWQSI